MGNSDGDPPEKKQWERCAVGQRVMEWGACSVSTTRNSDVRPGVVWRLIEDVQT